MIGLTVSEDRIATVTLDDPASRNAISPQWAGEFRAVTSSLAARNDVKVVVLRASGTHFCVGGDVAYFAAAPARHAAVASLADDLHVGVLALASLPAPVIAAVQGPAAGAGLGLVLGADIAVAAASASFVVAYTAIGLSPDAGCSYWLPRRVGARRAAELALTNRRVGAEEGARIGLVTEVVADQAALDARVGELAAGLAAGSLSAGAAAKRLLEASWTSTLAAQLDAEAKSIAELSVSPDGSEGIAAFSERRRPGFG